MSIDIEKITSHFGNTRLEDLAESTEFYNAVCLTGENMSRFLSRRYSLMKPKIQFKADVPELVEVQMMNGFDKVKTLLTIERNVWVSKEGEDPKLFIYIKDDEQPLHEIEDEINEFLGIKGWKFDETIRNKKIKEFVTFRSPYAFDVQVLVNTLSTYANLRVRILYDFVYIDHAFKELAKLHQNEDGSGKTTDQVYTMIPTVKNPMTYAQRYKYYRDSLPYVSDINHI